ncbi:MAG: secretion protein HlyD [Bdellovibrio sp.]|nr:MAG: secretion protein HlyD [Bdellovibrio sp.]
MKYKFGWVIVGAAILAILLAGSFYFRQNRNYDVVKPKRGDIVEAIYALGKVMSNQRYELKVGILLKIRNIYVHEGEFVKKGTRLIDFDPGTAFLAPFDGTVTLVAAYVGETAVPQSTVLRMEDLKDRYIELSIEQEGALRVRPGQAAKVSFESMRGQNLLGKVTALFPKENEFIARVEVMDLDQSVLPGMTADVTVEAGKIINVLMVPIRAISQGQILVERKGTREKIKVDVGRDDGLWAEIKGGDLNVDDNVLMPKTNK